MNECMRVCGATAQGHGVGSREEADVSQPTTAVLLACAAREVCACHPLTSVCMCVVDRVCGWRADLVMLLLVCVHALAMSRELRRVGRGVSPCRTEARPAREALWVDKQVRETLCVVVCVHAW
jgi:hypothetical protein